MQFPTDKFIKFAKQYGVPDYVKTATTSTFEDISDPSTKVACYLARFASLVGEPTISTREQYKRAEILNIGDDIDTLEKNYADFLQKSIVKIAAPKEKYPIRNKTEFQSAAKWLMKNAYALPVPERRELAGRLVKKASEYGSEIDEQINKFAGEGIGDVRKIIPNLLKRADYVRRSQLHTRQQKEKTAQDLEALAELARLQPKSITDAENLDKLAATLQFIDNEYGLYSRYNNIDPPDDTVFAHSNKVGQEIEKYACALGDEVYNIRDFERLKIADIIDTLGEDFAVVMSDGLFLDHKKIAEVLDVMNDLERILFRDMVKAAGIKPQCCQRRTISLKKLAELF